MGAPTAVALVAAAFLAVLMSLILATLPLDLALGAGLVLAVLLVAFASNQMALYLLIFAMLLGPEVVVGGIGGGTTLGRGLTFRLDDLLLAIVGFAWLAKTALHQELGLVLRTSLNAPIAAYACASILATAVGITAERVSPLGGSLFVLKYIQYFVIYFMVVNNLRERRQFERFLVALLATAAIASVIGVVQIPSGERVAAPFEGQHGEPNTFGGYLVLMLAVLAGLYLTSGSVRRRAWLAGLSALLVVPLLFTLSRATYLALIPLAGTFLLWSGQRLWVALAVTLTLASSPLILPTSVLDRIAFTVAQPFHSSQIEVAGVRLDTSTSERMRSWEQAVLQDWPRHPLLGYGVTGYRFLDSQYPRVLTETGLVGLVAFLWLQWSIFRRAREIAATARDPLFRGVAFGFLAGFLGLVGHSIGANTFIIVRIMEPFWFLAGMVMAIPRLEAAEAAPAALPSPVGEPGTARWRTATSPRGPRG